MPKEISTDDDLDLILVPRKYLASACHAIRTDTDAPYTLEALKRYALSQATKPDSLIAGRTVKEWEEFARRDDCLDSMVPSDLRQLVGAATFRDQMTKSAVVAVQIATDQNVSLATINFQLADSITELKEALRPLVEGARKEDATLYYLIRVSPEKYRKARDLLRKLDADD